MLINTAAVGTQALNHGVGGADKRDTRHSAGDGEDKGLHQQNPHDLSPWHALRANHRHLKLALLGVDLQ